MSTKVNLDIQKMIDVNTPIIYINTYDFVRVDYAISQVVRDCAIKEWNPITGVSDFSTKEPQSDEVQPLASFLKDLYLDEFYKKDRYIILRDIQDIIDEKEIKSVLQLMALRRLYDPEYNTTVFIISSILKVPVELKPFVSYLDIGYPDEDEINRLIDEHVEVNQYEENFKDEDRNKLMPSLKGLTAFEIDRMLDMAMSSNGTLSAEDREMINRHKKQMVKNSGVLELIDTPENLDSIGGLDVLKSYLKVKAKVLQHLPEAQAAHVTVPKGVFIIGMPGCGKSLCAKASAALFQSPLLKMDMGSMMGKYVGESEANLRHAIKIAEAAAPCVLWIDEIEKAFSGVGGNNDIMTRMFGYFLSWMQDKTSSVYVIATANNADNFPPELKRKGRFDEIFCVNLPNNKERKAIFQVHLSKRGYENLQIDTPLLNATNGFNGADIESVVNEAVEDVFVQKLENGQNVTLTSSILLKKAKSTISISKSCNKQIESMKKAFAESNFKDASL